MAQAAQRSPVWPLLVMTGIATLVYAGSFAGQFALDDFSNIVDNERVRSLTTIKPWAGLRALVEYSFAVNYWFGGLDPWGYHFVNLVIHVLAGLTLYGLVRRTLLCPRLAPRYAVTATPLATAIALVWLVHPLTTQAVTYVVQRYESAAALWYLLALYSFRRGVDAADCGFSARWWWASVIACFLLGLRSKETVVTLPLVLLWYDRVFVARRWRNVGRHRWLYAGLLLAGGLLAGEQIFATGLLLGRQLASNPAQLPQQATVSVPGVTPVAYLLSQPSVLWHYLRLSLLPFGQCLDYGWPIAKTSAQIVPPLMALVALLAAIVWAAVRHPAVGFLGGAFFIVLAPTSSLLPIQDLAAEHRMYLPLAAVATLVVSAGHRGWKWCLTRTDLSNYLRRFLRSSGPALMVVAIAALSAGTMARNRLYASPVALWTDNCLKSPHFWRPRHWLGKALYSAGDVPAALQQLSVALDLEPRVANVWATRGMLWAKAGQFERARSDFSQAIEIEPQNAVYYYNRGMAADDCGRSDDALADCDRALEIDPRYARAYAGRAALHRRRGDIDLRGPIGNLRCNSIRGPCRRPFSATTDDGAGPSTAEIARFGNCSIRPWPPFFGDATARR